MKFGAITTRFIRKYKVFSAMIVFYCHSYYFSKKVVYFQNELTIDKFDNDSILYLITNAHLSRQARTRLYRSYRESV